VEEKEQASLSESLEGDVHSTSSELVVEIEEEELKE
jgi:hypothetical protein